MELHRTTFAFYRLRFHFRALDPVHFPPARGGNILRGALGFLLRETAGPETYTRLFEPGRTPGNSPSSPNSPNSPSGLRDWPRPFVLRAAHLDGLTVPSRGHFAFDLHLFDLRPPARDAFRAAFERMSSRGVGPGRGRAGLTRVEHLDLADRPVPADGPSVLSLEPDATAPPAIRVRFATPTELKAAGQPAPPEFAILFARLRDRIATLRALYGDSPLEIDFRAMGERAASVRLLRGNLTWEHARRRSARTGQTHPLGGFTGDVEYEGDLAEFLPWLRAARWTGVGRQTVWGKGEVRVQEPVSG